MKTIPITILITYIALIYAITTNNTNLENFTLTVFFVFILAYALILICAITVTCLEHFAKKKIAKQHKEIDAELIGLLNTLEKKAKENELKLKENVKNPVRKLKVKSVK